MATTIPAPITLALLAQRRPPIELPPRPDGTPGRVLPVRAMRAVDYELWRGVQADATTPESDAAITLLLARAIPTATEEERGDLEPEQMMAVLAVAAGVADQVIAQLAQAVREDAGEDDAEGGEGNAVGEGAREASSLSPTSSATSP